MSRSRRRSRSSGLASAALAANAVIPPGRPASRADVLRFGSRLLGNELAPQLAVLSGLKTLSAARDGRPVATALRAAATAGFTLAALRQRGTGALVEAALDEALPPDWRTGLPGAQVGLATESFPWHWRLTGLPLGDRRVQVERSIPYVTRGRRRLRLDVYRPRPGVDTPHAPDARPVLVHVHGGAWVMGSRREQALPLEYRLAAHGWMCVSIDYRLSPRATWPAHVEDVAAAVAWVRDEGRRHGAAGDFVALTGGSAGGHLVGVSGLAMGRHGLGTEATSVQACVPLYGVYDLTDTDEQWTHSRLGATLSRFVFKLSLDEAVEALRDASPRHLVHADAPPMLVIGAGADSLVPRSELTGFVSALREASGAPVAAVELPWAEHAFDAFASPRTAGVAAGIERFLIWALARHRVRAL